MNPAIEQMLERYVCQTRDDYVRALREILQQIALLGLWRGKFFEHAAFYGGTALRVLYGLDRYSEDLDFSLLKPSTAFSLGAYGDALRRELASFGFEVSFESRKRNSQSAIESAFLKANTLQQLIIVKAAATVMRPQHAGEVLKIKLEVDTDPPGGFETESRAVLLPVPFAVRAYSLPDLFAGKMHALLCRRWKTRTRSCRSKGRRKACCEEVKIFIVLSFYFIMRVKKLRCYACGKQYLPHGRSSPGFSCSAGIVR